MSRGGQHHQGPVGEALDQVEEHRQSRAPLARTAEPPGHRRGEQQRPPHDPVGGDHVGRAARSDLGGQVDPDAAALPAVQPTSLARRDQHDRKARLLARCPIDPHQRSMGMLGRQDCRRVARRLRRPGHGLERLLAAETHRVAGGEHRALGHRALPLAMERQVLDRLVVDGDVAVRLPAVELVGVHLDGQPPVCELLDQPSGRGVVGVGPCAVVAECGVLLHKPEQTVPLHMA